MSADIDDLDINQLKELAKKAEALIEQRQQQQIEEAYNQIVNIAQKIGMSLEELIEYGQHSTTTTKRTVAPRYRNPNDPTQTWTGRGKKPRWVIEALENGKTLEDLMI